MLPIHQFGGVIVSFLLYKHLRYERKLVTSMNLYRGSFRDGHFVFEWNVALLVALACAL